MKYQNIKYVKNPVSRLIFGCAFPKIMAGEDVSDLLDIAYGHGITTFDTAENYGLSEVSLGKWINARGIRKKVTVISKCCHPYDGIDRVNPRCMSKDLEKSFDRMQTDFIDIYLLHRDDFKIEVGPIVETLNKFYEEGKIGAFGGSNWTASRIEQANDYAESHGLVPFTVSSPNYGLAVQVNDPWGGSAGSVSLSGPDEREQRTWYRKHNMPVIAYSSLARGLMSGRVKSSNPEEAAKLLDKFAVKGYCCPENFERLRRLEQFAEKKNCLVSQAALAWLLNQAISVFPIITATKPEHMISNLGAFDVHMTKEEIAWLDLDDGSGEYLTPEPNVREGVHGKAVQTGFC